MALELPSISPDVVGAARKRLKDAEAAATANAKAKVKLGAQAVTAPTAFVASGFNPAAAIAATHAAGEIAEKGTGALRGSKEDAEGLAMIGLRHFNPDKKLFDDEEGVDVATGGDK